MSTIVEHADVDISPLFNWSKKFEIISKDTTIPVYIRVLGDADMGRARVAALRRSAELRKKLKNLDSDERLAFIKDIDDLEMEQLVSLIIVFSMRELSERAVSKIRIKAPKAPRSDAKTELHEKYQEEIDSFPERRQAEIKKLLEKEVDVMKLDLEKETKETLYKKYVTTMINELCEQELLTAFKEWCAYLGSYRNEELTERLFVSFDDFANLPSQLKEQFISEYSSIELYGDDLKKLHQVMP